MASSILPREGAWVGGLLSDGFAVQCRADQACTVTIEVSQDTAFTHLAGTVTPDVVIADHHYRGTAFVTDLVENTAYHWRVKLDNGVDAVTYGTEATHTAGKLRTHATENRNWTAVCISCVPWGPLRWDYDIVQLQAHWTTLTAQNADFHFHDDDIYYADINSTFPAASYVDYEEGNFYMPSSDADATAAAYRTDFINTYSAMSHPGDLLTSAGLGGQRNTTFLNSMAEFKAKTPGYFMAGDHEYLNDADDRAGAIGDLATRWTVARDTVHEFFGNLNKPLIEQEAGRTFTPYSSWEHYFYVDIPPVRFLMLDPRVWRDANDAVDAPGKTLYGATQLQWIKDRIDDNTQDYLVIFTGVMLDGFHGWDTMIHSGSDDGMISFTYERDEMMNYIYSNGNSSKTVVISGDTHESGVFKYVHNGEKPPIYEILAGNSGWDSALHGWVNGLKAGVSGNGCEMELMLVGGLGFVKLEHIGGKLRVSLIITDPAAAGCHSAGCKWSKWF